MDISHLSPQELTALKAQLGLGVQDNYGRSPIRPRQLNNLTLLPTATDPRPTFFMSAVPPRDGDYVPPPSNARLLFHQTTGEEITVYSDEEEAQRGPAWGRLAPRPVEIDTMASIQAAFDALSPEDQKLLIDSQKQDRIAALKAKVAALDPAQLEKLLESAEPKKVKKTA